MSLEILRENYLDQPFEVSLETLARCNAACTFCPYPQLERIGIQMDTDLIYRVIDEMGAFTKTFGFCPFKVNEPLLDKRLYAILKRFDERTDERIAGVRLFTNGSPLTWDRMEELDNVRKLDLFVSLHTHIKEEYEPLMGLKFDRVAKNLDELHGSMFSHPVTILRVGGLEDSVPFQKYVYDRWPRFKCVIVKKDGWLGFTDPEVGAIPDTPCARWFELNIMANGKASLCCMDGEGKYGLGGDLHKQTLLEIYNMPAWRERREKMLNRKLVPICQTCSY